MSGGARTARGKAIKHLEMAIATLRKIKNEIEDGDVVLDVLSELVADLKAEAGG